MRFAFLIIIFLLTATFAAIAQRDFSFAQALDISSSQWISAELEKSYHSYFHSEDCPPHFQPSVMPQIPDRWNFSIPSDDKSEKEWIDRMLKEDCMRFLHLKALSDYYFPKIAAALQEADLPEQYIYLPVALSALNREYISQHGRAGMWQLSYLEARRFGLVVDNTTDQRHHPESELRAAIRKLSFLHKQYDNPELVIAAWIKGVPYCNQILARAEKNSAYPWDKETSEFLRFYSVCVSALNAFLLPDFSDALTDIMARQEKIHDPVPASFKAYAAVLSIEQKDLFGRNPWLTGTGVPNISGTDLYLPSDFSEKYYALRDSLGKWDALQDSIEREKARLLAEQANNAITHKVRQGDVLGNIARKYNVGVSEIKGWNNLKRDLIYVGQELLIYTSGNKAPSESSSLSGEPGETTKYTVRSGDNLWSIARKFPGVSPEDIMDINEIDENIVPGQVLLIPQRK